jgi:methylmalonyl-CoA/ethylmalonyl-CoA epimerase
MDADRSPGIEGIHQIHVPVRDLDRATAYYRDVLGIPYLFTAPPGMAFFQCGAVRLLLGVPEGGREPGSSGIIYYRVADIEAAATELEARGVTFINRPHRVHRGGGIEVWLAEFADGEGNTLALMSELTVEED